MTLKSNRELTNEIASPKKFLPNAESKDFTREEAINPINKNFTLNPIVNLLILILQTRKWKRKSLLNSTSGEPTKKFGAKSKRVREVWKHFG